MISVLVALFVLLFLYSVVKVVFFVIRLIFGSSIEELPIANPRPISPGSGNRQLSERGASRSRASAAPPLPAEEPPLFGAPRLIRLPNDPGHTSQPTTYSGGKQLSAESSPHSLDKALIGSKPLMGPPRQMTPGRCNVLGTICDSPEVCIKSGCKKSKG